MTGNIKDFRIELKPKKPVVPVWLAYVCSFLYLVEVVLAVAFLLGYWKIVYAFLVVLVVLIIMSNVFSWNKSGVLYYKSGVLRYELADVVSLFGSSVTRYKIHKVSNISNKKCWCMVSGDIEVAEPLRNFKKCGSAKIFDITEEALEKLMLFKNI